jgi:hypothetical protein
MSGDLPGGFEVGGDPGHPQCRSHQEKDARGIAPRAPGGESGRDPSILLAFEYGDDHRPHAVVRSDDDESTRDWILGFLAHGPASVGDMAEDLLAQSESGGPEDLQRTKERLGKALYRMVREGWLDKLGTRGRGVTYRLALRQKAA